MKTAFTPSFRPSRTFTHPILGKIDEYRFDRATHARWRKQAARADFGIQAFFIPNNAKPHNDNHYALKVYETLTEAAAAWERQNLAARKRLAPPVRRICKFVYPNGDVRWGYQTAVASHIERVGGADRIGWFGPVSASTQKFVRALQGVKILGTINDGDETKRGKFARVKYKRTMIYGDLHAGNIGFYKHKMVLIDFGTDSVDFADRDYSMGGY